MRDRLQIDCPLPTPLHDIVDMIIAQTVEKCGTQLKAAFALGITPEMISRRLNHRRRKLGHPAGFTGLPTGVGAHASDLLPAVTVPARESSVGGIGPDLMNRE